VRVSFNFLFLEGSDEVFRSTSVNVYLSMIEGIDTQEALLVRTVEVPPARCTTSEPRPSVESYIMLLHQHDDLTVPILGKACPSRSKGKKRFHSEIEASTPAVDSAGWTWPAVLQGWVPGSSVAGDSEAPRRSKRVKTAQQL
jgi:hypothetical protein